jgi:hypothetical protein
LDLIAPARRQSAPVIVLAIYLTAQKLYLTIYRRKGLGQSAAAEVVVFSLP